MVQKRRRKNTLHYTFLKLKSFQKNCKKCRKGAQRQRNKMKPLYKIFSIKQMLWDYNNLDVTFTSMKNWGNGKSIYEKSKK